MSNKLLKTGSVFLLAGVLASIGATAHAANINTSGVVFRNFNAGEALDIDYLTNGARDINANPRSVVAPIPRSPVASAPSPSFFIDGENTANTSTSCTVFVYDFFGNPVASQFFTEASAGASLRNWDHAVTFTAAQLATFNYASVVCTIPGSANGILHGVTAVQP
ncbi:MAG TPA: hypothetical protein VNO21_20700 [Polyangiaceae bacterium]|nr:hypothetical protein [Polyangiaceae bacterium]